MSVAEARELLARAEDRHALKIFENISRERVEALPLADRLEMVGEALMERTDWEGWRLGRAMLACAERMKTRC